MRKGVHLVKQELDDGPFHTPAGHMMRSPIVSAAVSAYGDRVCDGFVKFLHAERLDEISAKTVGGEV